MKLLIDSKIVAERKEIQSEKLLCSATTSKTESWKLPISHHLFLLYTFLLNYTHNCLACFIIESVRSPKLKSLQLSQSIYLFILSLSHTRWWDFQVLNLDASPSECVWRGWNEWWELRFNNVKVYVLDGGGRGGGGILGGNYATFNEDSVI